VPLYFLFVLTKDRISNLFDLQKHSADIVTSKLVQIHKELQKSAENYDFNIQSSKDNTSIQFIHKDFDKMSKEGMKFQTTLKLTKQKSDNLYDLIKQSDDGKIKFDATEIEQIVISKDGIPVYVVNGLKEAELSVKKNIPIPRMVNLVIPNGPSYDYVLLQYDEKEGNGVFSNVDQTDYPIDIKFNIDFDKKNGGFHISSREDRNHATDAKEFFKFMNSLADIRKLQVIDQKTEKVIFAFDVNTKIEKLSDFWRDVLEKLVKIERKMNVTFPYPSGDIMNKDTAFNILNAYDIITKGTLSGSISSVIGMSKKEIACKKFIKSLSEKGFSKGKFTVPESKKYVILGQTLDFGSFSISGKITTDEPPMSVVEKYAKLKDDESIDVKIIFVEGDGKVIYKDWVK